MVRCALCRKYISKDNGSAFCVPAEEPRRQRWNIACIKTFKQADRVCYRHFVRSDFSIPPGSSKPARLRVGAVPTLTFAPSDNIAECCPEADVPQVDIKLGINEVSRISCCTQTDRVDLSAGSYLLSTTLQQRIKNLEAELAKTKEELEEAKSLNACMSSIFTEGQIRKLKQPEKKNIFWDSKDISNAFCLHAAGPKAYGHLYQQGFPLPHVSTLQRWAQEVEISEGILSIAIDSMRHNTSLSANDKICVLSFDEMKVTAVYEHDPLSDSVREPCNYVMVIAQGLRASWKCPVFYEFDCKMTRSILAQIIQALRDASFPVVAVVSDMGPTNQALWKELQVSREKPWFESPAHKSEKVFVFADVPHLVKLIRNHFLDTGIIWNDVLLTCQTLKQVLNYCSGSDMSIAYKLTDEHLAVRGPGRQKVKLAAQLFSNTTACAIRWCHINEREVYQPLETASFIQLVNDWFDVFNAKMTTFNYPGKKPYGNDIQYQKDIITKMDCFMEKNIIPNKNALAPFQTGVLLSNAAIQLLHDYVKENYDTNYILTHRLNQDVLEHFFGTIRSKGGLNDHPNPPNFRYRLRKYILAFLKEAPF